MVKEIFLDEQYTKAELYERLHTEVNVNEIHTIVREDTDCYNIHGELLFKFRKKRLPIGEIGAYYDAVYSFTNSNPSCNRGTANGDKVKSIRTNKKVYSSIIGYYDKFSPNLKYYFTQMKIKPLVGLMECRFTREFPEKMLSAVPLLTSIHNLYEELVPDRFALQNKKAKETEFTIGDTCFTTATTNLNFQTRIHLDKGDCPEGFGNLAVIERGTYSGGETCLPQYGVGVDVRQGDILFIDVHRHHGNLPIYDTSEGYKRMSVVAYLRNNVWLNSKGQKLDTVLSNLKSFDKKRKLFYKNRQSVV
tara:strand:+ start:642 stop:1556 length:915 start_codon:yes stop_codon:yes gene_type:complete